MNQIEIINKLKANKGTLERNFSITKIGLFGSYSKGQPTTSSDVDLLYELEEGKRLGFKDVDELERFFKDMLQVDKVDLVNQNYLNPIIEEEIKKNITYV